jgi:membrane protein DedA with SNARE-associated domain
VQAELPGIFGSLEPILVSSGYLAVFGVVFIESFGVPAPGQTIIVAASVYAGAGRLNIVAVAAVAFAAAVVGDNIGYAIGRLGGRRLALRFGRYVFLTEPRLAKVEDFFARHGGKIVSVARFVDGLRQFNGVVAGIVGMPWWRFLAFNAIGAAAWVGVWSSVGYFAGDHLQQVYDEFRRYQLYLLIAAVALIVGLVARWWLRRRRRRGSRSEPATHAPGGVPASQSG